MARYYSELHGVVCGGKLVFVLHLTGGFVVRFVFFYIINNDLEIIQLQYVLSPAFYTNPWGSIVVHSIAGGENPGQIDRKRTGPNV